MDNIDFDKRLASIGKELEKDLGNWEAWAAKADILYSLGMYEISIRCCDRSLAINPDDVLSWITRANALEKLGRHEEALDSLAKARELEPTCSES